MINTDWTTRYTEEIDCCVLLNITLCPVSPFYRPLRRRNYLALFSLFLLEGVRFHLELQENLLLRLTGNHNSLQRASSGRLVQLSW